MLLVSLVTPSRSVLEHAVLYLDVDREPVGRQHAVAAAEVHRERSVARELGAADAAEKIESARQGDDRDRERPRPGGSCSRADRS